MLGFNTHFDQGVQLPLKTLHQTKLDVSHFQWLLYFRNFPIIQRRINSLTILASFCLPSTYQCPKSLVIFYKFENHRKRVSKIFFLQFNVFFSISVASVIILKKDILFEAFVSPLREVKRSIKIQCYFRLFGG